MHHPRHSIWRLAPLAVALSLYGGMAAAGDETQGYTIGEPDAGATNPPEQSNSTAAATKHQAEVSKEIKKPSAAGMTAERGMPATEHQEQALRAFQAADADGDGKLSEDEYVAMQDRSAQAGASGDSGTMESTSTTGSSGMEQSTADQAAQEQQQYGQSLHQNEQPGVDSPPALDRARDSETEFGSSPQHADR